ncbi:Acid protease [Mycena indigotica]|uniref:Acid protease n=1 Tax=Mycena indigotica TaxID=2126181 RepID=A0A8H6W395_9AGAR|nr:Acid protease [Mycena indigotica]KAF7301321.1 Acid protease [Mycena indigotica]
MQLLALLACALLVPSLHGHPIRPRAQRNSGLLTLPVRRVERNTDLHVDLRHQQNINRAQRLVARAAGLPGPSDVELLQNLHRRAEFIPELERRFNIPQANAGLPTIETSGIAKLAVENDDDTSDNAPPKLANFSSVIEIDGADTSYVITVQIGTPARDFNLILDSGSGDLWVSSDQCTSENGSGCGNHTFLGSDVSSSFVNSRKKWSITYGSGFANGEIVNDTIVIAGMVMNDHTFGVAHSISSSFSGDTIADGLMGLSKSGLSTQGVPTPVEALRNLGFFKSAITSYRLPRLIDNENNGEVTFGGLDETKFDPSTRVDINASNSSFWIIPLEGVSVDGQSVAVNSTEALMDNGTTLLVVPTADAVALHSQIPGAKQQGSGQFSIPCDTTTNVSLRFGGRDFAIDPKDLVFASRGRKTGDCTSGIGSFDDDKWLVGDTFLKAVYFSTNVDANTVTLAKAI